MREITETKFGTFITEIDKDEFIFLIEHNEPIKNFIEELWIRPSLRVQCRYRAINLVKRTIGNVSLFDLRKLVDTGELLNINGFGTKSLEELRGLLDVNKEELIDLWRKRRKNEQKA